MIKSIQVTNYTLLKNNFLNLKKGFTVISGKTGSGKSILLDALCLLLGKRYVRNTSNELDDKIIIEATFLLNDSFNQFFINKDLDFDKETVVRREIKPNGKSRSFINDTPVLLNVLAEFGSLIVEIYAQGEYNLLNEQKSKFNFIDQFSNSKKILSDYQKLFSELIQLEKDLDIIRNQGNLSETEVELLKFQFQEIDDAMICSGEKEKLDSEIKFLENIEDIKKAIHESEIILNNDNGLLDQLLSIKNKISHYESLSSVSGRINSLQIELDDICHELNLFKSNLKIEDQNILTNKRNRLDIINNLLFKYRLKFEDQLIELKNDFNSRIELSESFDILVNEKKRKIHQKEDDLKLTLASLNESRSRSFSQISKQVKNILKKLGMPYVNFTIQMNPINKYNLYGNTELYFMFSANKGIGMMPVEKIASGGEISRLMLALKYINIKNSSSKVLIFDEIDSGVSGQVASMMADIMHEISQKNQLIAISHLPQVASKALNHLKVEKKIIDNQTCSIIFELDSYQRVEEIAKLLSGKKITKSAIDNANDLLNQ